MEQGDVSAKILHKAHIHTSVTTKYSENLANPTTLFLFAKKSGPVTSSKGLLVLLISGLGASWGLRRDDDPEPMRSS